MVYMVLGTRRVLREEKKVIYRFFFFFFFFWIKCYNEINTKKEKCYSEVHHFFGDL